MRNIDFSTMKTGDVLLTVLPSDIEGYYFFGGEENLWVVEGVNRESSAATVVSVGRVDSSYILTENEGEVLLSPKSGAPEVIKPVKVKQFTHEEATIEGLFHRVQAERKLCDFVMYSHKNNIAHPVHNAIEKAYRAAHPEFYPSTQLDDTLTAWERMRGIWRVANEAYKTLNDSDLSVIDEMLTVARGTVAEIVAAMDATEIEYRPGKEITITQAVTEGFSTREYSVTFREGATASVRGVPYLITRLTKSRAHVTDYTTGEEAGYLTFTKSKGVILKLNDGTEEWAGHNEYTEIPASTKESVTAYSALEEKVDNLATNAYATLRGMAQNVITNTDALNAANRLYRTFTTGGVAGSIENLHRIIINLETAKEEITEQTEAVLWKFERLINRAYGE
jgi:hypothetical protein